MEGPVTPELGKSALDRGHSRCKGPAVAGAGSGGGRLRVGLEGPGRELELGDLQKLPCDGVYLLKNLCLRTWPSVKTTWSTCSKR